MRNSAILGGLLTCFCHAIVPDDGCDAQTVVLENPSSARRLRSTMTIMAPPRRDGRLIAPERQRQQLVGVGKALKSFDRNESVHVLQVAAQPRGMIQVVSLAAIRGPDLEDDGDHDFNPEMYNGAAVSKPIVTSQDLQRTRGHVPGEMLADR